MYRLLIRPVRLWVSILLLSLTLPVFAQKDLVTLEVGDEAEIDVRIFKATGNRILLGFACDEGSSISEEETAMSLAEDGIEVWMPDMLGGYMLPKSRSSIHSIPSEGLLKVVNAAVETGKDVYLIASGSDTELILRVADEWEAHHESDTDAFKKVKGAVLMFPRLNAEEPLPGKEPRYVETVGKTHMPLMVLEGARTPNRWGLNHLVSALEAGGSQVFSKVIPEVRGYFFKREDPNMPEEVVTSQLSGMVKASMFYLERAE